MPKLELQFEKIHRGPKLEGCAFAYFGNSSGTEGEPRHFFDAISFLKSHYSKCQIFVQKIQLHFYEFSPIFLIIFLVKSKLSTAKKCKTTTFSRVFHSKFF